MTLSFSVGDGLDELEVFDKRIIKDELRTVSLWSLVYTIVDDSHILS